MTRLWHAGNKAGKDWAGGRSGKKAERQGGFFLLLRAISHFTYEMVRNQGRNCHGWQFQEAAAWMPLASAPAGLISFAHFISEI